MLEWIRVNAKKNVGLIIAKSVYGWARRNGYSVQGTPIATSLPCRGEQPWRVLIQKEISEEEVNGVLGRLDCAGHWGKTTRLRHSQELFFKHLALHELAHIENDWSQAMEDACDEWAFERIGLG